MGLGKVIPLPVLGPGEGEEPAMKLFCALRNPKYTSRTQCTGIGSMTCGECGKRENVTRRLALHAKACLPQSNSPARRGGEFLNRRDSSLWVLVSNVKTSHTKKWWTQGVFPLGCTCPSYFMCRPSVQWKLISCLHWAEMHCSSEYTSIFGHCLRSASSVYWR